MQEKSLVLSFVCDLCILWGRIHQWQNPSTLGFFMRPIPKEKLSSPRKISAKEPTKMVLKNLYRCGSQSKFSYRLCWPKIGVIDQFRPLPNQLAIFTVLGNGSSKAKADCLCRYSHRVIFNIHEWTHKWIKQEGSERVERKVLPKLHAASSSWRRVDFHKHDSKVRGKVFECDRDIRRV